MNKPVILCVDDEKIVLSSLKEQLKRPFAQQFTIETVESGEEALELFYDLITEKIDVPLIITDHIMPGIKGDELLIEINKHHPEIRKVLLTGQANADAVGNAVNNANLYRYISKPWEQDDLILTVREATTSYFQSKRIKEQEAQYKGLVEAINVGVYRTTEDDGIFLQANPAIARIFGYDSVTEFMATTMSDHYLNPEERASFVGLIREHGSCKNVAIQMQKRDGTPIWASFSVTVKYKEPGNKREDTQNTLRPQKRRIKWMDGVIEDVTERKKAKEHLINLNLAYERFVPQELLITLGKKSIIDVKLNDQVQKKMSILFSDIRLFSTLSESMTPQENFSFINSYLSHMGPIVRENHGFIDKYIGDAIMALFERQADDALSAAIVMLVRLTAYNQGRKRAGYRPIQIGIGINTGNLILGTLGEQNRMEGTVISDAVNAASRLESLTKEYGVPLLISEHTFHELKDPSLYAIRFVDRVLVKGKSEPISVYEVFDTDPPELRRSKLKHLKLFENALYHYHFGNMDEGCALLQRYILENPSDTLAGFYLRRSQKIKEDFSPENPGTPKQLNHLKSFQPLRQPITWNPEMSCGLPQIDEQHRHMFDLIAGIMETIRQCRGEDAFFKTVEDLEAYTAIHFTTEEEMMNQSAYPGYEHHKTLHNKYRKNLDDFIIVVQHMGYKEGEDGLHLLLRIQHLLGEWFLHHVDGEDKNLGYFLQQQNNRQQEK